METIKIKKLNKWANSHTSYPIDILRIALGVFLFLKGVSFIKESHRLIDLLAPLGNFDGGMLVYHYVAAAHIMGGVMIVFGLLTRWAIWAQLPILVGAVLINFVGPLVMTNLIISVVTLIVCVFFLMYGGGKHSLDYYFKMEK
ncbi:DoxX family protein [Flavobacterium microcysteis]|uniref:DoxX family protein n=1 Tax=Flavobacterium microcysteis TaxID=2596891 RepID=A0A501QLZ3_9FLAO|nr:DoxX family protein [Flavobacterium microcysteis]TPD73504.1 DoxX family protein [Flavobacterium microcysteis]